MKNKLKAVHHKMFCSYNSLDAEVFYCFAATVKLLLLTVLPVKDSKLGSTPVVSHACTHTHTHTHTLKLPSPLSDGAE